LLQFKTAVFYLNIIKFIPVIKAHHYSSLQCHMILQKSLEYDDLMLKKHLLLLLMSKAAHIFVETIVYFVRIL